MEGAGIQLPKYRSHKEVWALKIKHVWTTSLVLTGIVGCELEFEDDRYARLQVGAEYAAKHGPQAGGYYVVYEDGYKSFSPAEAFESGYTRISP